MQRINKPNKSQEDRILQVLKDANGKWINGQYFIRDMMITQYHRAIYNLEKRGVNIGHSKFKDEYGFLSYRLVESNLVKQFLAEFPSKPAKVAEPGVLF